MTAHPRDADMKSDQEALFQEVSRFLKQLFERADLDLQARLEPEESTIEVRLQGSDAGIVLSNNARLMYAVNHLLNQIFLKRSPDGSPFLVDCNDYRNTRVLELRFLARKAAEKVKASGAPLPLQPMPSYERRVIHVTLADEPGIRTVSEGGGDRRHVIILPAS